MAQLTRGAEGALVRDGATLDLVCRVKHDAGGDTEGAIANLSVLVATRAIVIVEGGVEAIEEKVIDGMISRARLGVVVVAIRWGGLRGGRCNARVLDFELVDAHLDR